MAEDPDVILKANGKLTASALKPNGLIKSALPISGWQDLNDIQPLHWVVEDFIPAKNIAVLFGESGSRKTFLAADMAGHVAIGKPWHGRAVEKGGVIYVAAENAHSVEMRFAAFQREHDTRQSAPFGILKRALNLVSGSDIKVLTQLAKDMSARLIVIDTLAWSMPGFDENSAKDIGTLFHRVQEAQQPTGAAVIIIHHTGKDTGRGERGSYAIRGNCDSSIEVTANGETSTATVLKMRDGPNGAAFTFRLRPIEFLAEKTGATIKTALIDPADRSTEDGKSGKDRQLPKAATIALRALHEAIMQAGEPAPPSNHIPQNTRTVTEKLWRQYAFNRGVSDSDNAEAMRKAFKRSSEQLIASGHVAKWQESVWPC